MSSDTVFYSCLEQTKYVNFNQWIPPYFFFTYHTLTDTIFYTDLISPIQNYPFMPTYLPCYVDSIDTIYAPSTAICSKKTWHKQYIGGTSCFEEPFQNYDYLEGCGGPYYNYFDAMGGCVVWQELIYFIKGIDTCGFNIPVTVGVSELSNIKFGINISPNPFTSQTTITFNEEQKNTTIKIRDVVGNVIKNYELGIKNGKSVTIDMSSVAKGIYFVEITDEKKNTINKKIIVQ